MSEKLVKIRQEAGLSSTIGTAGKTKAPLLFGKDEYKQRLTQEILLIGTEELHEVGFVISNDKLYGYFKATRTHWKVKEKEIDDVINELEKNKIIPPTLDLKKKQKLIRFKPVEVSQDYQQVLIVALGLPSIKIEDLENMLNWTKERAEEILKKLIELELAIYDIETENYYLPCVSST